MKERYIELPDSCEEMTPEDWADAMRLRQRQGQRKTTALRLRTLTARNMLARRGLKVSTRNQCHLHLVAQLARSLGWLWQESDAGLHLAWDTSRQPMPQAAITLAGRRMTVYGPADYGQDLLFGEYREAVALVRAMDEEPGRSEELLCELAGLLWRPADDLGRRYPYDSATRERHRETGSRMRPWQRQTALIWLDAMTRALHTDTFIIGGEEASFGPLFTTTPAGADGKPAHQAETAGLYTIGLTVAESGVFGTMEQVEHTPLLHVLLKLLRDKEKIDRLKK